VPELHVDGRRIADDEPVYVIAEIGHNHQGDVEKAKALIHAAKECGVDAVKLQKRDNHSLYTRALYDSPYDNEHSFGATYGEHREALELGAAESASPIGRYAAALAFLVLDRWDEAHVQAGDARASDDFPGAVADALASIAAEDMVGYVEAVENVLESFETRTEYLEDVPVADTVLVLQALASRRGMAAQLESPLLPD